MNAITHWRSRNLWRWHPLSWRLANLWWSLRVILFVRILHVADKCQGCGRIIPREWKTLAAHLHFYGPKHFRIFLCKDCGSRESILEQFFYDPEWDDDDPFDEDAHPRTCDTCGGEIAGSWSTCTCDDEEWQLDDSDIYPPSDRFSLVE